MNKSELVASIAEKSGLTKKDAEQALNGFISSVQEALADGEKVQLVGFGTFEVRQKKLLRFLHLKLQFSDQVKLLKKLLISKKREGKTFFFYAQILSKY